MHAVHITSLGVPLTMASKMLNQYEPWGKLDGKVVMVTGASSGLGREFCVDLAKAGCKIVAAARRTDRLQSLCQQINSDAAIPQAAAVELDLMADSSTIELVTERAWSIFGRIDALINNAGVRGGLCSSLDLSEEEWENVVQTNLKGSWLVSKYVGQFIRATGRGGCIINISSISGLNRAQFRGGVAYASSKAGLDTMTKVMALELGMHNIRVNSIAPCLFRSEITENLVQKEWLKNVAERSIPLKTFGTSDPALTSVVRYLIDDSSKYVTGNIFIVDAGYTLPGVAIFSSL